MRRDVQPFTINGRFSTQAITGVQRYAHEIVRGIDKIHPQLQSSPQSRARFVVRSADPLLSADAPGSKSDVTDFDAGASKCSILHFSILEAGGLCFRAYSFF